MKVRDMLSLSALRRCKPRLDSSYVRIHKLRFGAFFLQGLYCLGTGVVEFARFPDFDGARPDNKNFLHFFTSAINLSNRNSVSRGPGDASGWNWTAKNGSVLWAMPSIVLSFTSSIVASA